MSRLLLRVLLLCSIIPLAGYAQSGDGGVWAAGERFATDYQTCPLHRRVTGPEALQAVRGLKAGELRVSWQGVPVSLPEPAASVTVIVDDGANTVVRHVSPEASFVDIDSLPLARGLDLDIAVALTRQQHVISNISQIRLMSYRTSTANHKSESAPQSTSQSQPAATSAGSGSQGSYYCDQNAPNAVPAPGNSGSWTCS